MSEGLFHLERGLVFDSLGLGLRTDSVIVLLGSPSGYAFLIKGVDRQV